MHSHCNGSWKGTDEGGDFEVLRFPGEGTPDGDFMIGFLKFLSGTEPIHYQKENR